MANFRKSFNFRNGVQVDDDNLVVNSNGLVGVGTTVPTETLDVRGTAKIVGLVTASHISTPALNVSGVGTFGTISDGKISISSGIITAVSGVVTFYGDGVGLVNIPTSQWIDTDVGLGFTSIYAAGNVGIATSDPRFSLQIGRNPNTSSGVGINSLGNILASGIITATTFVGELTGNVAGNLTGNVNSTGVGTFNNLKVGTVTIGSGVVTATTFRGTLVGDVTGTASTATSLSGTPNITVGTVTASKVVADLIEVPNTGVTTVSKLLHVGTGGTAFAALEGGRIGVGTAIPTSEFQIRKSSGSLLEVISDTGNARISVGQVTGVGKSTGVLRFGDTDKTLDLINNDTGNLNYYLHAGSAGVGTGRFEWVYGQTNAQLMSLTYGGSLGLCKTNKDNTLHVVGTSTVTGNAFFGNNVTILGSLSAASLSLPTLTGQLIGNVYASSGVSTFSRVETTSSITVSTGSSIGIGTTRPIVGLDLRAGTGLFGTLGVGTDAVGDGNALNIGGTAVIPSGSVGIGTTTLISTPPFGQVQVFNQIVDLYGSKLNVKSDGAVGFNTYLPRAIFDFGNVGSATTRPLMVVPNISSSTRNGIGQTPAASIIYNTTLNQFQGYVGSGASTTWVNLNEGAPRYSFTNSGSSAYVVSGTGITAGNTINTPLYLARGQVYEFVNNASSAHPLQIRVSSGGAAYDAGVTNNGTHTSGVIIFEVPLDAPNTLFYQCTAHSGMGGTITVYPNKIT
jgi:hypothetical protein